jgi:hypothetical protein
MNARTTEVCWDPTLVRVEYLDEAGTPYSCCFNARAQPPTTGTSQGPHDQANPPQREQTEAPVGALVLLVIQVVGNRGDEENPKRPACRA